jgi:hypothetical protein
LTPDCQYVSQSPTGDVFHENETDNRKRNVVVAGNDRPVHRKSILTLQWPAVGKGGTFPWLEQIKIEPWVMSMAFFIERKTIHIKRRMHHGRKKDIFKGQ